VDEPVPLRGLAAALTVLALAGCGSSSAADDAVRRDLLDGISRIRGIHNPERLRSDVLRTVTRLRHDRARTAADRRAKELALEGFSWTLQGIESRIAFAENDSGNIEAAVRDAKHADRALTRGARLLRAAGRRLGVRLGNINGF
jgi:hypothetical protein